MRFIVVDDVKGVIDFFNVHERREEEREGTRAEMPQRGGGILTSREQQLHSKGYLV